MISLMYRNRAIAAVLRIAAGFFMVLLVAVPYTAVAAVKSVTALPSAADRVISSSQAPHRIYFDPAVSRRNQLLVFLPGTGGVNSGPPRPFSITAAGVGYHVIELAYPNDVSATVCWRDSSPDCFERFRREIIDGSDVSPLIAVSSADSIKQRLLMLLRQMVAKYPDEGWGRYLTASGGIAWGAVALAGQSQGGGHAALIARDHEVARVLLFGAPKDFDRKRGRPAAWYRPGRTPAERFFALAHTADEQGCSYDQQLEIYRAMGMVSPPYSADDPASLRGAARILVTSYPGNNISSKQAHVMGIANQRFKPVWKYMLTAE